MVMLTAAEGMPEIVEPREPPVVFTPGNITRKSMTLRVAIGRLAIWLTTIVVEIFALCDCTISTPACTVTISLEPPT